MVVTDTSPLIFLAKVKRLSLLKSCFGLVSIPKSVLSEINKKSSSIESKYIEQAIKESWIVKKETTTNLLLKTLPIGIGEKDAISLAADDKDILLLDDAKARSYAELLHVECYGTLFVLLLSLKKKIISKNECKNILDELLDNGFYISTPLYKDFLGKI